MNRSRISTAILVLAFAGLVQAESARIPSAEWPKWSPPNRSTLSRGVIHPDRSGVYHGLTVEFVDGVYQVRHTSTRFADRGITGEGVEEPVAISYSPPQFLSIVSNDVGELYVFFVGNFGSVDEELRYFSKAPGDTWVGHTVIAVSSAGAWVKNVAVSVIDDLDPTTPDTDVVCYYEKVTGTYPGTPILESHAKKFITSLGDQPFVTHTNYGGGPAPLSSDRGRLYRGVGGLLIDPPPGTPVPVALYYYELDGTEHLVHLGDTANTRIPGFGPAALGVDDSGLPTFSWMSNTPSGPGSTIPTVTIQRGFGIAPEAPVFAIDGTAFRDHSGVLHRLFSVPSTDPATGPTLRHSVLVELPGFAPAWSPEARTPMEDISEGYYIYTRGMDALNQIQLVFWHVTESDPRRGMRTWEDNLGSQGTAMSEATQVASVNLANGNLYTSIGLFGTAGNGPNLALALSYNSMNRDASICGQGWSLSAMGTLQVYPDNTAPLKYATLTAGDGRKIVFYVAHPADPYLVPMDRYGVSLKLTRDGYGDAAQYTIESPDGSKSIFNSKGKAVSVADPDGNALTFTYGDNPLTTDVVEENLISVTDAFGRSMGFEYDPSGILSTITDPGTATYSLVYDTEGFLKEVSLPGTSDEPVRKWSMTYYPTTGPATIPGYTGITGIQGLLATMKTPQLSLSSASGMDCALAYRTTSSFRGWAYAAIDPFVSGSRKSMTMDYSTTPIPLAGTAGYEATYTDRQGKIYLEVLEYTRGLPLRVVDPVNGSGHPTLMEYDPRGNMTKITGPSGLVTEYTFVTDAEGLAPWVQDLVKTVRLPGESAVTTYEYHPTLNRVTKITPVTGAGEATTFGYNSTGHVTMIQRPDDPAPSTMLYDGVGRLMVATDQEGKSTTYTYGGGAYGLPTSIQVDGIENEAHVPKPYIMDYNVMGQTVSQQQPFGGVTTYAFNAAHQLDTVTPPADSGGGTYRYKRDANGAVVKSTDANLNASDLIRDDYGRVKQVRNARGDISYTSYTDNHWVESQTDFGGHLTHFEYDDLGRMTYSSRLVDSDGVHPDLYLISITEYDSAGNVTREIVKGSDDNPPPRITVHEYDSRNLQVQTTLPGGDAKILYYYNSKRELVAEETWTDPGTGFEFMSGTCYVRDKQGRVVEQIQESETLPPVGLPAGRASFMAYNPRGLVSSRTSPLGHTSWFGYDDAGRQVLSTDPTGVETVTEYTEDGQVRGTDIVIPGHAGFQRPTTNIYNSRGQMIQSHDNVNPTDYFFNTYDDGGRLLHQTGPLGMEHSLSYDVLNRVSTEYTRKDTSTLLRMDYRFDAAGNMTTRFNAPGDPAGPAWTYEYNAGNRQKKATTPLGAGHDAFTRYDALGNVVYQKDEDGNETFQTYDIRNRLIETTWRKPPVSGEGTGALWETITRTYDGVGNVLSIEGTVSGIRVEYQYKPDAPEPDPHTQELRKVVWKMGGVVWKSVEHDYDGEGRRTVTRVKDASGTVTHTQGMGYDDANRLTSISNDSVTQASFTYEHGFLTETTLGNGNRIVRTYDIKGRLETLEHLKADGTSLAKIGYTFDKLDRRDSVTYYHLGITSTFTYTNNSWLASETHTFAITPPSYGNPVATADGGNESSPTAEGTATPHTPGTSGDTTSISYSYDQRGNRLAKDVSGGTAGDATYLFDAEDRLLSESRDGGTTSVSYTYANRGDMIAKTVTTGGTPVTSTYTTDFLARITAYSGPTASWQYLYAPTGDRIAKTNVLDAGNNEWYLPDSGDTLADFHKTIGGAEEFSGIYVSPGVDGRVARVDAAGTPTFYFGDSLNSVHQMTNSLGAVTGTNFTDAWGNNLDVGVTATSGPGSRYGYTGREKDSESGLMHYRARSYDPLTGRFTSRDPVPYSNLYVYVYNDPLSKTDSNGTDPDKKEIRQKLVTAGFDLEVSLIDKETPINWEQVISLANDRLKQGTIKWRQAPAAQLLGLVGNAVETRRILQNFETHEDRFGGKRVSRPDLKPYSENEKVLTPGEGPIDLYFTPNLKAYVEAKANDTTEIRIPIWTIQNTINAPGADPKTVSIGQANSVRPWAAVEVKLMRSFSPTGIRNAMSQLLKQIGTKKPETLAILVLDQQMFFGEFENDKSLSDFARVELEKYASAHGIVIRVEFGLIRETESRADRLLEVAGDILSEKK